MTSQIASCPIRDELSRQLFAFRHVLTFAFIFSAFVGLLQLSAPIYMLQVYDRVLASRSVETLVALSLLLAGLLFVMGLLDHARARIMARIGARFQAGLEGRVQEVAFRRLMREPQDLHALAAGRDLDTLARFWASPAPLALFDLPWLPVYFAALFLFHPLLGWVGVAGGLILLLASWANQRANEELLQAATLAALSAERMGDAFTAEAEVIRAMGIGEAAISRWRAQRVRLRAAGLAAADISGGWTVAIRTFRLFLQSAILGLGAFLVLREDLSAGAMVASSILTGRAMFPLEQIAAHWPNLARARHSRVRLFQLLATVPEKAPKTALPRPAARVEVQGLTVIPPGGTTPSLRGINFSLAPGQIMGVIGPTGSGKSSLARALVGVWQAAIGQVRLDGATLDQFDPALLGGWIGYLPQRVTLFEGTVAENIARLQPDADAHAIIAAAEAAGAHEMILQLPEGYDTQVFAGGSRFSGGQIQRIGLARAVFGDPVLVVLDEPNANLDVEGSEALNRALRAMRSIGAAVLIMAHRPAALQECDLLLVLKDGAAIAFGPRDRVLREAVRNASDLAQVVTRAAAP